MTSCHRSVFLDVNQTDSMCKRIGVPHMQLLVQTVLADLALKILISSEVPRLQLVCLPVLVVGGTLRALMTAY